MEHAENERLCKELADVAIGQALEVTSGTGRVEIKPGGRRQPEAASRHQRPMPPQKSLPTRQQQSGQGSAATWSADC